MRVHDGSAVVIEAPQGVCERFMRVSLEVHERFARSVRGLPGVSKICQKCPIFVIIARHTQRLTTVSSISRVLWLLMPNRTKKKGLETRQILLFTEF